MFNKQYYTIPREPLGGAQWPLWTYGIDGVFVALKNVTVDLQNA